MLALLLAVASVGQPGPQRLAILPTVVAGPHGQIKTQELFELIRKESDFRSGLDILVYNALFVDGVVTIARTVRECGADIPCIAKALELADIDLGLRVVVNFAIEPPLITLSLIDAKSRRVISEALTEQDERAFAGIVRAETEKLLDAGGHAKGGRISVALTPPDAKVSIQPEGQLDRVLTPGAYRITARKEGYLDGLAEVTVEAGREASVELSLLEQPSDPGIVASPWLWTGIGVGVIAVVATVLIVTNPFENDPTTGTVCITTPARPCP